MSLTPKLIIFFHSSHNTKIFSLEKYSQGIFSFMTRTQDLVMTRRMWSPKASHPSLLFNISTRYTSIKSQEGLMVIVPTPTTSPLALSLNLTKPPSNLFTFLKFSFFLVMCPEHPLSITHIPFLYNCLVGIYNTTNSISFSYPINFGSLMVSVWDFWSPNSFVRFENFVIKRFVTNFTTRKESRFKEISFVTL